MPTPQAEAFMGEHDASYRRLFQHSQLLHDLLACVLDAEWLAGLDWSGLQPVNIHYVSDQLHERAGRLPDRNLAALLFRLEHSDRIEKLQEILQTLQQVLRGPGFEELNRSFTEIGRA